MGHRWGFVTSKMAAVLIAKISGKCNFAKTSGHELNQESCPRGGALDDFVRWEVSPGVGAFVQT